MSDPDACSQCGVLTVCGFPHRPDCPARYEDERGDAEAEIAKLRAEVETLKRERDDARSLSDDLMTRAPAVHDERDRYRKALEEICNPDVTPGLNDCTEVARKALAGEDAK